MPTLIDQITSDYITTFLTTMNSLYKHIALFSCVRASNLEYSVGIRLILYQCNVYMSRNKTNVFNAKKTNN